MDAVNSIAEKIAEKVSTFHPSRKITEIRICEEFPDGLAGSPYDLSGLRGMKDYEGKKLLYPVMGVGVNQAGITVVYIVDYCNPHAPTRQVAIDRVAVINWE